MDKKILEHEIFIKIEIEKLEQKLEKSDSEKNTANIGQDIQNLNNYHQTTVRNYQHERLIHLIVTFFFASLLILSIIVMFLLASLSTDPSYALLNNLVLVICGFLFITEIFYVRHYYQLENGTQRLYQLSKKLYELTNK